MRSYLLHVTRFAAAGIAAVALAADAPDLKPPVVPPAIQVPAGNKAFALGHATGTQGYICLPSGSSYAWSNTGSASGPSNNSRPEAILFNGRAKEIITHFLSANPQETSPNPSENGQPRPTWQSAADNSTVWGNKIGAIAAGSDPTSCPNTGAIKCLLLQVVGSQAGPTGGTRLSVATYIQRLNTNGGSAPASPQSGCAECCAVSTDVGNQLLVPYIADYWFYKASE